MLGTILLFVFMLSPLIVSIILMITTRKDSQKMFYMKYIGLGIGFFNTLLLTVSFSDNENGMAIFTFAFYTFIIFPINAILFFICLLVDLSATRNEAEEKEFLIQTDKKE
ncbi:hypothetical protein DCE79_01130 [Lysinibacillus sp. 2017]|uniref:hypothetical protein n=1 Tax=unclassified Lysinibacillus TaxID=2636778 RepID=UPI000D52A64F|nr:MULTISPECIES: hypothetical protein [unclassified Lysinibacillus]AWE06080.1 hypothetical protein DCE79_01130 [Lysinibacillus sp. 2017]TGN33358.1 hypothetical protein E4L99_14540 [Lysinibacillus sp. S2017]